MPGAAAAAQRESHALRHTHMHARMQTKSSRQNKHTHPGQRPAQRRPTTAMEQPEERSSSRKIPNGDGDTYVEMTRTLLVPRRPATTAAPLVVFA